jgi:hypothetical protein
MTTPSRPEMPRELLQRLKMLEQGRTEVVNPARVVRAAAGAQKTPLEIIQQAGAKALGGGIAGAAAMAVQVGLLESSRRRTPAKTGRHLLVQSREKGDATVSSLCIILIFGLKSAGDNAHVDAYNDELPV